MVKRLLKTPVKNKAKQKIKELRMDLDKTIMEKSEKPKDTSGDSDVW